MGYYTPSANPLIWVLDELVLTLFHGINAIFWLLNSGIALIHNWPHALQFVVALICGGIMAAVAGLIVGVPSLRLRGDYLALSLLDSVKSYGSSFKTPMPSAGRAATAASPTTTTFFWVYAVAAVTIYIVVSLIDST